MAKQETPIAVRVYLNTEKQRRATRNESENAYTGHMRIHSKKFYNVLYGKYNHEKQMFLSDVELNILFNFSCHYHIRDCFSGK